MSVLKTEKWKTSEVLPDRHHFQKWRQSPVREMFSFWEIFGHFTEILMALIRVKISRKQYFSHSDTGMLEKTCTRKNIGLRKWRPICFENHIVLDQLVGGPK